MEVTQRANHECKEIPSSAPQILVCTAESLKVELKSRTTGNNGNEHQRENEANQIRYLFCEFGALSQQLDVIDTGLGHIEKYKSKCAAILKSGNGHKITDLCEALPGILKQLECKAEHLSPCTTKIWISAYDIELVKEKIPHLCFVSPGPVLECIKDTAVAEDCVTATGLWAATATSKDIIMRVGESECTNVKIVTPGSVLTFTVPDDGMGRDLPVSLSVFGVTADSPNDTRFSFPGPCIHSVSKASCNSKEVKIRGRRFGSSSSEITASVNGVMCSSVELTCPHTEITCTVPPAVNNAVHTLTITVAGQKASSTLCYGVNSETWEWDTACCGNSLVIPANDKSTVTKPRPGPSGESTVIATTQLIGDRVL
ncbi:hypothetical protein Pelo_16623 [Pelomyxa schiedti]|nr:hypothetical protein Pelo_16623 [Pelomyxa schiedti]